MTKHTKQNFKTQSHHHEHTHEETYLQAVPCESGISASSKSLSSKDSLCRYFFSECNQIRFPSMHSYLNQLSILVNVVSSLLFFLNLHLDKKMHRWHKLGHCRGLAFNLQITKSMNPFIGLLTSLGE